jgi:putative peptidoglycan lipid II flippase
MALLASVPAMLGLVLMAEPLNATLYQYGRFTAFDTRMAALSLMGLSIGLPGFMLAKVLAPAFYARQDTRAPVRAAVLTVIANLVLMGAIVGFLVWRGVEGAHAGIALATALAGTLNAVLLWRALGREGTHRPSPGWPRFLWRTAVASLAMVGFLLWARYQVGAWSALAPLWRVIHLAWIVAGSVAIYAAALLATGMRPRHLREA